MILADAKKILDEEYSILIHLKYGILKHDKDLKQFTLDKSNYEWVYNSSSIFIKEKVNNKLSIIPLDNIAMIVTRGK